MIDKRLVGLVTCEVLCRLGYAKAFAEDITATVAIITPRKTLKERGGAPISLGTRRKPFTELARPPIARPSARTHAATASVDCGGFPEFREGVNGASVRLQCARSRAGENAICLQAKTRERLFVAASANNRGIGRLRVERNPPAHPASVASRRSIPKPPERSASWLGREIPKAGLA